MVLRKLSEKYPSFLTALFGLLLLFVFYPKELTSPNSYYMGFREDGLKNYYTFDYHIRFDSSYTHFGGMNYPYGEHIVFTDAQPLLAFVLKVIHDNIFPIGGYTIGIVNLLMLLGLVCTALILLRILSILAAPVHWAIPFSVLIAFMSPQLLRITGHYALAYAFVVPWFIWQALLFSRNPGWKRSLVIAAGMLIILWIHLYYLLIAGFFLGVFYLLCMRKVPAFPSFWKLVMHLAVQVVLPLACYFVWLKLTDTVSDRPSAPYGMMEFMAYWEGTFLPLELPLGRWLKSQVGVRRISFEAITYVGLPATVFFVTMLLSFPARFLRRKERTTVYNPVAFTIFSAGLIVFLYAALVPYLVENEALSSLLGPLRQFRSLGRLGWVFFYALNIWMLAYLVSLPRKLSSVLLSLSLMVLGYEVYAYNRHVAAITGFEREKADINTDRETVILPLPYFHIGSENIGTPIATNTLIEPVIILSMESGMRTHGSVMSRTSIGQTVEQLEFAYNLSGLLVNPKGKYLIISDTNRLSRYREVFGDHPDGKVFGWPEIETELRSLYDSIAARGETPFLFYESYDDRSGKGLSSKGALELGLQEPAEVLKWKNSADSTREVELIFWVDANRDRLNSYRLSIDCGGETRDLRINSCFDNVVDGFARCIIRQTVKRGEELRFSISCDAKDVPPLLVDELLLLPAGKPYVYRNGYLFSDGFVFK